MLSLWVLFSAVLALSVTTTVDDCPASLIKDGSLEVSNGFCFYFAMKEAREYKDAERFCEQNGGTLALVKTRKIHDFIYSHLKYRYGYYQDLVYIGLNDIKTEGNYMWEDGTSLGEWQNWANGYGPEDSIIDPKFSFLRDCVAIDLSQEGRWVDYHCEEGWFIGKKNPFICQFNVTPKTTTPKQTTPKPTTPKPTTPNPTTTKPTTPKPTTPKPITPKPTTPKQTTPKPTTPKPTTSKQTTPKPTAPKPTTSKHTTPKPTTLKPTTSESTTQKPTTPKPFSSKRTSSKPTTQVLKPSKPTCPPFSCSVDCGMEGYKSDTNGCAVCICDV